MKYTVFFTILTIVLCVLFFSIDSENKYLLIWPIVNTALFSNFLGSLDGTGFSQAQHNSPALDPAFVGAKMYYAFCLYDPFNFRSNVEVVEIVP